MNISVEKLTKTYGVQNAVDDISFKVNTGEILGFLGPNGAGKTTTMKIITCYMAPTDGDVKVGSYSIQEDQEDIKKRIGYLPEHNPLYKDMFVMDYLDFSARLQGVPKTQLAKRTREMIGICGLDREKHKRIDQLSKGYRQRVGLAQALIHDPEILILDEPTTGLDPNQIVEIRNLIKDIGKEKTVILSTHILPEVEATCDRMMIINQGKIVADGSPDTIKKQAQGQEVLLVDISGGERAAYLDKINLIESVASAEDKGTKLLVQSKNDQSSARALFDMCVQNKWYITELTPMETSIEDIFRDLTLN